MLVNSIPVFCSLCQDIFRQSKFLFQTPNGESAGYMHPTPRGSCEVHY